MKKTLALMSVAAVALSSATIPTATSQPTPVTNKLSIVQLGDSFSAGKGAGSYVLSARASSLGRISTMVDCGYRVMLGGIKEVPR